MSEAWHARPPAPVVPRQRDRLRLTRGGPDGDPDAGPPGPVPVGRDVVPPERLRLLFGLQVAAVSLREAVALASSAIESRSRLLIGVVNAAKVVRVRRDAYLRDSLLECDVLLADGQSIVWTSRILGQPLPGRVAGIDLFESFLDLADRDRRRVYLLGARQDVLDRVVARIADEWPNVVVAGSRNGYFEDSEGEEIAKAIAASHADMLFLGMTTPKKEVFLGSYGELTGVPVLHGVGGSFDVLAGVTQRAPLLWQRCGLEWAYRLVQEPRRLWRRYLVTNSVFVGMALRERLHPRPAYQPTSTSIGGRNE